MEFSIHRLDLVFDKQFKRPAFKIVQDISTIVENFHEVLNVRFPHKLSDLQIQNGNSPADIFIRVLLLNGNGHLELGVDHFRATFINLNPESGVALAKDCLELCEQVLLDAIPDLETKTAFLRTSGWLECDGGEKAVAELLGKFGAPAQQLLPEGFGATEVRYSPQGVIGNKEEGWTVSFRLERSAIESAHLFFVCDGTYSDGGRFDNLEDRINHVSCILGHLSKHFGLIPRGETTGI